MINTLLIRAHSRPANNSSMPLFVTGKDRDEKVKQPKKKQEITSPDEARVALYMDMFDKIFKK